MLRALRRIGQEPALFVVIAEGDGAREFLRRFGVWQWLPGVPRFDELGSGDEGVRRLDLKLRGHGSQHFGLLLREADALITLDQGRVLEGLNIARDSLERVARGPLVLIFSEGGAKAFAEWAPDLYDARTMTATLEVIPDVGGRIDQLRVPPGRPRQLSDVEAEIRDEMESETPIPFGSAIDRLLTVAQHYQTVGDGNAVDRITSECVTLSRRHGYAEGIGRALCAHAIGNLGRRLVDLSLLKAEVDEALSLAREHHLDRLLAFAAVCRAQLYNLEGLPQEASRLLRESALPAMENIGNQTAMLEVQAIDASFTARDPSFLVSSIKKLRENIQQKRSVRCSADSISMSQHLLAILLIRTREVSACHEAIEILRSARRHLPSSARELRADNDELLAKARAVISNQSSPGGPNRAARRAKRHRR